VEPRLDALACALGMFWIKQHTHAMQLCLMDRWCCAFRFRSCLDRSEGVMPMQDCKSIMTLWLVTSVRTATQTPGVCLVMLGTMMTILSTMLRWTISTASGTEFQLNQSSEVARS
jgi:hypothetical protein